MSSSIAARDTLTPPPALTRKRLAWKPLAAIAAGLAIAAGGADYGYRWWTTFRFVETTDDAYVGGNVTALSAHVPGFVDAILVRDNERVHAGQVLIRLDQRDYRTAEAHAEATVAARRAALEDLRAQYAEQDSTIRQQDAEVAARAAQAAFALQDANRYRDLAQTSAGSRQDAQRAAAADLAARSAVLAANAGLTASRQHLAVLQARIAEAEAMLAAAAAELRTAQLNLEWTQIRAPIGGFVGNRLAEIGAYAAAGSYLISVIPSAGLWVDANFKEDQLAAMRRGRSATVTADVLPDHPFRAHVESLAPGTGSLFSVIPPENATGNFTKIVQRVPVRVELDPGDGLLEVLRPGLSATVSVDTRAAAEQAPQQAAEQAAR